MGSRADQEKVAPSMRTALDQNDQAHRHGDKSREGMSDAPQPDHQSGKKKTTAIPRIPAGEIETKAEEKEKYRLHIHPSRARSLDELRLEGK